MLDSAALRSLRSTLQLFPVEWTLWAMDADGIFQVHEGPGVYRKGIRPGESVGMSVWALYRDEPRVLAFVRSAMRRPTTDHLVFNGYTFLVSGAPAQGGGALGLALVVGPVEEHEPVCTAPAHSVVELTCSVPELGAEAGDLVVVDPEDPEHVGFLRRIPVAALPAELAREVSGVSRSSAAPGGEPSSPGRAPGRRPGRASHLRLLP